MKRYQQILLWVLAAPLLGLVQASASFLAVLARGAEAGALRLVISIAAIYGTGWFLPALLLADVALIRRSLSWKGLGSFVGLSAAIAAVIGLLTPGMMVMIGYPLTALAILLLGALLRKRVPAEHA